MRRGLVVLALATAVVPGCSADVDDISTATNAEASTVTEIGTDAVTVTVTTAPAGSAPVPPAAAPVTTVGDSIEGRGFEVFVPSSYHPSTAAALVVLLHGYSSSGLLQEKYFGMQSLAEDRGFLYVHPDGSTDARGNQFWNATDACCNLMGANVDDSSYLAALIDDVRHRFNVDPKRIYLAGHSNGGFMSYRMACDHAGTIAAIASLAGATFADTATCRPSEPVSVLQIHGTGDSVIGYDGGSIVGNTFPSALATVESWAAYNGCATTLETTATELDLEMHLAGEDTRVDTFADCPPGGDVELWTIEGGAHSPALSATFASSVIDFLLAHPKP